MQSEALFRDKPVWTAILTMAIPSVFSILIMILYSMVNMFFVGQLGGTDSAPVATVAVVVPVFSVITAAAIFKKAFPNRHFDCGIAESDMMCVAAGLATTELVPFVSSFAMFAAGRAFEQVRNSIGYPHLNVKIGATHDGISVGEDGASHQCCKDFALMRSIPGMVVMSPADDVEAKAMVKAAELLAEQGISARVINMATIKPLDEGAVLNAARECGKIVTCEEHSVIGGLGEAVCAIIAQHGLACPVERIGVNDEFGHSGPAGELLQQFGLSAQHIAQIAREQN